jgi:hypothetical protein
VHTGGLCARGIEDYAIGRARGAQAMAAMTAAGLPRPATGKPLPPPQLTSWTSDYLEITDDVLPQGNQYWSEPQNDCWQGLPGGVDDSGATTTVSDDIANARYNMCATTFGAAADADKNLARDMPILEAYDDHFVVGRFYWRDTDDNHMPVVEQTTNRTIVGADPTNAASLKTVRCCFHHQAAFRVRTGGEWVTLGLNSLGLLHHVQADPTTGRCVLSCDPRETLLNARTFDVPWAPPNQACPAVAPAQVAVDRSSPLAMRNPMVSFVVWSGCGPYAGFGDHTISARDFAWRFSMRGGFSPMTISLTGGTVRSVSPQSMRFIDALGQLAVVDGELQGLVLIDLNTLGFAHSPYF